MAFSRYKSQFMPVSGFVFSIIGLIYSLIMSFGIGAEALCLTSGCAIVQDFKIFGISPWWAASLMFAIIAALCFFHMRVAARILASLFLAGDCVFLLAMFFVAPCTSCLGAAFLIFCVWAGLRIDRAVLITARRIMAGAISAVWLVLFILNLGYALNELLPGWKLTEQGSQAEKKISLYFSPSCTACREALQIFAGRAMFYPVAENDDDYAVIADISTRVAAGESVQAALAVIHAKQAAGSWVKPQLSFWRRTLNAMKLMRNQATVLRQGYNVLPVIVFEGLPTSWVGSNPAPAVAAPQEHTSEVEETPAEGNAPVAPESNGPNGVNAASGENGGNTDLPLDFGDTLDCGRGTEVPCE